MLAATALLVRQARPGAQATSACVFGGSLVFLFGTSALYHRVEWRPGALRWVRRIDHAAIYVAIAGSLTPLFALVPSAQGGHGALAAVWVGAVAGVATSFAWSHAPAWLRTALCTALGAAGVAMSLDRAAAVGASTLAPLVAAGVVYAVGGVVYATRRPDPSPKVFGYHEVFHALVILGCVPLFGHVALLLGAT